MNAQEHPETVRVTYWAEYRHTEPDPVVEEIPWDQWAAMTAAQRQKLGEDLGEALASIAGGWGWEVDGPEPDPAPDPPEAPPITAIAAAAKNARADHVNAVLLGLADWWVPTPEERDAQAAILRAEWDKRNPALAAVIAHADAARDARRAAKRRAQAAQRKARKNS